MNTRRVVAIKHENEFGTALYLAVPLGYRENEFAGVKLPFIGKFDYLRNLLDSTTTILRGEVDPEELYFLVGYKVESDTTALEVAVNELKALGNEW